MLWAAISNTRLSVSCDIQTLRSWLKQNKKNNSAAPRRFNPLLSTYLVIWWNVLHCIWYITTNIFSQGLITVHMNMIPQDMEDCMRYRFLHIHGFNWKAIMIVITYAWSVILTQYITKQVFVSWQPLRREWKSLHMPVVILLVVITFFFCTSVNFKLLRVNTLWTYNGLI